MQISDEMLGEMIYRALYQHQGGLWECVSPRHFWYDAASRLRAALSALSLPVQPVAWRVNVDESDGRTYLWLTRPDGASAAVSCRTRTDNGETIASQLVKDFARSYTTPPVPPTKGLEDDLRAAREAAKEAGGEHSYIAVQSALLALRNARQRCEPVAVATHCHVKTGCEYTLLGFGRMQSADWWQVHTNGYSEHRDCGNPVGSKVNMREVAIYRGADGKLWARPREEFEDGRFAALTPSVQP